MAIRKPADTPELADPVALVLREHAAFARALCHLAVAMPGAPASTERILSDQLRISRDDTAVIVAAAQRPH